MSNASYLTLAFTQKYKEQRRVREEMNATERDRQVRVSPSLYLRRWTEKKGTILKSDASEK